MKRIVLILLSTVFVCGATGWLSAQAMSARQEKFRTQRRQAEQRAYLELLPMRFAAIIKTADRITVEIAAAPGWGLRRDDGIEVCDETWRSKLAGGFAGARYVRTALPLGLFFPLVHVYKDGKEVLFYQGTGLVSCHEADGDESFRLDVITAAGIARELLTKLPNSA